MGLPYNGRETTRCYEDKTKAEIDIVYGRDVRDWWYAESDPAADRSKVAWTGENPVMTLVESYKIVSQSIVAISVKRRPNQPVDMPAIIGTGFIVGEGLVATNDHVVKIADQLA